MTHIIELSGATKADAIGRDVVIKTITVPQPWAWAIFNSNLDVLNFDENSFGDFDGYLAIQAGEEIDYSFFSRPGIWAITDIPRVEEFETGKILGTVQFASFGYAIPGLAPSEWADETSSYWLNFVDPIKFDEPIDFNDGAEGLRDLPKSYLEDIQRKNYPVGLPPISFNIMDVIHIKFPGGDPTSITDADTDEAVKAVMEKLVEFLVPNSEGKTDEAESEIRTGMKVWVEDLKKAYAAMIEAEMDKAKGATMGQVF